VRASGAGKVKVACSDIDGILRGKYLHRDKFFGAAEGGFGFCDVVFGWDATTTCYDNTQVTGWQHGFPDALARLDLDTARRVPWDGNVPFFLGEFVNADGTPYPVCPRQTLKRVLKRAEKLGFAADGRHGVRVVQLRRDAAELGRQAGRRPGDHHAGHVRLFAAAHERPTASSSTR
jgi:glutamine synthetase